MTERPELRRHKCASHALCLTLSRLHDLWSHFYVCVCVCVCHTYHTQVIYYGFISDSVDDAGGHGTHVAGSLVCSRFGANATGSPDLATGMTTAWHTYKHTMQTTGSQDLATGKDRTAPNT